MPGSIKLKGPILFGACILVVVVVCIAAYAITGDKGIEDRFAEAVGLEDVHEHDGGHVDEAGEAHAEGHDHEHDSGLFGFFVEGNFVYYGLILAALIAACGLLYLKSRA